MRASGHDPVSLGDHSAQVPVEVRVLRVLQGNGTEERFASVFCPIREQSLTLEECTSCEHCSGLCFDRSERRSRVLCNGHSAQGLSHSALPADAGRDDAGAARLTPVSAVMGSEVIGVRPDVSVEALKALLIERNLSGVPVVDKDGKPIGMVSKSDVFRADYEAAGTETLEPVCPKRPRSGGRALPDWDDGVVELDPSLHECQLVRATVNQIMTPFAISLPENASLAQAAALMAYEGIHRLPIVSSAGRVVGLLSALDVLRWVGQQSGYVVPATTQLQRSG